MPSTPSSPNRRPIRYALGIALGLVVIDLLLRAAFALYPPLERLVATQSKLEPDLLPDPVLGHRPNPRASDHDARGFRNAQTLERADIVALGDSQTYGAGVNATDAWPSVLARLTPGRSVYNMAYGGWGPGQSLLLWHEVQALSPNIVVEAFYAGNDLYDTYRLVYGMGQLQELRNRNADIIRSLEARDAQRTLDDSIDLIKKGKLAPPVGGGDAKSFLKQHWALYRTLSALIALEKSRRKDPENPAPRWSDALQMAQSNSRYCIAFDDGLHKTLLTPEYRLTGLDLADPRIEEALRIALDTIDRMQARARAADVKFLVALIPTKEMVFAEAVAQSGVTLRPSYSALIGNETDFWQRTKAYLDARGIPYADLLPNLRAALDSQAQPYRVSDDGHPSESGYAAIAAGIHDRLVALGWIGQSH